MKSLLLVIILVVTGWATNIPPKKLAKPTPDVTIGEGEIIDSARIADPCESVGINGIIYRMDSFGGPPCLDDLPIVTRHPTIPLVEPYYNQCIYIHIPIWTDPCILQLPGPSQDRNPEEIEYQYKR